MKAERKISLEQLYNQRKLNTRMPEELKLALLKAAEHKKRNQQRNVAAILTTVCTILIAVLILPDQRQQDITVASHSESDEMDLATVQASSPAPAMRSTQEKVHSLSADAPVTSELMSAPYVETEAQGSLILKAVPNRPGLFENCSGEQLAYDIKTDVEGWFKAIPSSTEGWFVEPIKDCELAE